MISDLGCDSVKLEFLDGVNLVSKYIELDYEDGDHYSDETNGNVLVVPILPKQIDSSYLHLSSESGGADVAIIAVSYLKNGAVVGSSLVQSGSCELKLLKYKVELPRGAKVTLFDDAAMEAKFLAWNLPCPRALQNMTFLQVKAANGFEKQITPSAGSQSIELYSELGRRYAVFGEIWTYSFAQTLWFADLRIQKSNSDWQDCIPTAGEGGTIVTALPQ